MSRCEELTKIYREAKAEIEALKLELDSEMQFARQGNGYSKVQIVKEKISNELEDLKYEINPIPEPLRGKEGVCVERLKIGGKTADQLIRDMKEKNIIIPDVAMEMLKSKDFITSTEPESIDLINLKLSDLDLPGDKSPTIDEIYKRIKEIGLEFCPPDAGAEYLLKYVDQPTEVSVSVGMKQIDIGAPYIFSVNRSSGDLRLGSQATWGTLTWDRSLRFIFRIRPPLQKTEKLSSK